MWQDSVPSLQPTKPLTWGKRWSFMRRNDKAALPLLEFPRFFRLELPSFFRLVCQRLFWFFSAVVVSKRGKRGLDWDDFFVYEPRPGIQVPQRRRPPDWDSLLFSHSLRPSLSIFQMFEVDLGQRIGWWIWIGFPINLAERNFAAAATVAAPIQSWNTVRIAEFLNRI